MRHAWRTLFYFEKRLVLFDNNLLSLDILAVGETEDVNAGGE